jgi:hypothetical protein
MNDYINLCVDYNDRTKTYYNRKFLMVREVAKHGLTMKMSLTILLRDRKRLK